MDNSNQWNEKLSKVLHPNGHFFIDIEPLSRFCHKHSLDHQLITISKMIPLQRYIENHQLTGYAKSWLSLMGRIPIEEILQSTIDSAIKILRRFSKNDTLDDAWGVIIFRA